MKLINIFTITILGLMFTGCDDDSTTAALDCTTLKSNLVTAETNFGTEQNAANCDALTSAGSAFLSGGCVYCDADAEACLEDDSNIDTCCDEPTQDDLDELTAMCVLLGGGSDTDGNSDTATCMTYLSTYSENMSGMNDGSLTQSDCEVGFSALNEFCMASCEDTVGGDFSTTCTDMQVPESGWTETEITEACQMWVMISESGN